MKVPDNIKKAIINCAKYNDKAKKEEITITEWLERHKLTEDTCTNIEKNMTDSFIDTCQTGYNPEGFIELLEKV